MNLTLYRFYNTDNELLYVGITQRMPDRMGQHRKSKSWEEIATITLEHFETRKEVLQAEVEAIASEQPRWNLSPGHTRLSDGGKRAEYITTPQRKLLRSIASKGPLYYLRHPKDGAAKRAWLRRAANEPITTATVDALIRRGMLMRVSVDERHNVIAETWTVTPASRNANKPERKNRRKSSKSI